MPPLLKKPLVHAQRAVETVDTALMPARKSLFKRFPIGATLVVAFGVGATSFGLERVLGTLPLFNEHPWFTLTLGLVTLVLMGKVYAKLG